MSEPHTQTPQEKEIQKIFFAALKSVIPTIQLKNIAVKENEMKLSGPLADPDSVSSCMMRQELAEQNLAVSLTHQTRIHFEGIELGEQNIERLQQIIRDNTSTACTLSGETIGFNGTPVAFLALLDRPAFDKKVASQLRSNELGG